MSSDKPSKSEASCSVDSQKFISEFCKIDHTPSGDDSLFYFETDYLPLKGNIDYLKLMKTLTVLEVQRSKVLKDISDLRELKLKVLDDPVAVKHEILNGELECLGRIQVEKVPEIDFSKYRSLTGSAKLKNIPIRRKAARATGTFKEEDGNSSAGAEIKVRGRVYTESKPQTFNQLWTVEEQLRLEQLLAEIPPEPVEYRRWEKIAEALGSRTAQQVCSRVQKYFKKLAKAGLNAPSSRRKASYRKRAHYIHKQHKHFLYKPSTFFPGATMGELEETDSGDESSSDSASPDLSHWEDIQRRIREERANEELKVHHIGFKCKKCLSEPIKGTRWECKSCPDVTFCSDCMSNLCNMNPPPHPITHRFRSVDLFNNMSYRTDAFSCDNYLDPNSHLT